jgi:hypothetical protein
MTNEQRIAELEQRNREWAAWYETQKQLPRPQPMTVDRNYQYAVSIDAPPKKKKAAAPAPRNTLPVSQAEWYILLAIIGLIALRIIYVNFANKPPQRERHAKVTVR